MQTGNVAHLLESHPAAQLLKAIGVQAELAGIRTAVVGGLVRDLMLGNVSQDIDIVVEGDATVFARQLASDCGGKLVKTSPFGTALLKLNGYRIDLAMARKEWYSRPGALPDVCPATLEEDLLRRDFTINAMAVELAPAVYGSLRALELSMSDLTGKRLRIIHPDSFEDDPTRILRAARLAHRLGLVLEAGTSDCLQSAITRRAWQTISKERLGREVKLLLTETAWPGLCRLLDGWELFTPLFEAKLSPTLNIQLERVETVLGYLGEHGLFPDRLTVFALLVNRDSELLRRLVPLERLAGAVDAVEKLTPLLAKTDLPRHEIYRQLAVFTPAVLAYALILCQNEKVIVVLRSYIEELHKEKVALSGKEIAAIVGRGPAIKAARRELLYARLDGLVTSREEEMNLLRRLYFNKG